MQGSVLFALTTFVDNESALFQAIICKIRDVGCGNADKPKSWGSRAWFV